MEPVSDNGVSRVWREGGFVWKEQPKFLADNEAWCLQRLLPSGYVPEAERAGLETIRMEDLGRGEAVADRHAFLAHLPGALGALEEAGVRHGDLTAYSVVVRGGRPYLVDFAESRLACDPRPDKRREGDRYWLARTMAEKCRPHNERAGAQWGLVYGALDFSGVSVLDVGCGHGDLLSFALGVGAASATGVDGDARALARARMATGGRADLRCADLLGWLGGNDARFDVALCMSVLPYVDMGRALSLLADTAGAVVVECQYEGDGPGTVKNDAEMGEILGEYWVSFRALGATLVEGRGTERTVWLCQNLQTGGGQPCGY